MLNLKWTDESNLKLFGNTWNHAHLDNFLNNSQYSWHSSKQQLKDFIKNKNLLLPQNLKKVKSQFDWNVLDSNFQQEQEEIRQEKEKSKIIKLEVDFKT